MCIKESLRLFPPVPGMARKLTKPITFLDGRTIPAGQSCLNGHNKKKIWLAAEKCPVWFFYFSVGSLVGTSVYALHRNATVWENPNVSKAYDEDAWTRSTSVHLSITIFHQRGWVECNTAPPRDDIYASFEISAVCAFTSRNSCILCNLPFLYRWLKKRRGKKAESNFYSFIW